MKSKRAEEYIDTRTKPAEELPTTGIGSFAVQVVPAKTKQRMIYKAKLTKDENGAWHIISYANRLIPYSILSKLNNAVHDAIDSANGILDWKRSYIRFTYNGKSYHQIDAIGRVCEGCCFRDYNCLHPYFTTKGDCTGKIYKEEQ